MAGKPVVILNDIPAWVSDPKSQDRKIQLLVRLEGGYRLTSDVVKINRIDGKKGHFLMIETLNTVYRLMAKDLNTTHYINKNFPIENGVVRFAATVRNRDLMMKMFQGGMCAAIKFSSMKRIILFQEDGLSETRFLRPPL
jgi:hypothetical protein